MYILSKDGQRSVDARAICGFYVKAIETDYVIGAAGMMIGGHDEYMLIGYINRAEYSMAGNDIEILGAYETLGEAKEILAFLSDRIQRIRDTPFGVFDISKIDSVVNEDGTTKKSGRYLDGKNWQAGPRCPAGS